MGTRFHIVGGEIDLLEGVFRSESGSIRLTPNEVALLGALHEASPEPVSPEALLTRALGYASSAKSRTVTVTIQRLRKKIEADPAEPRTVLTVRGTGYVLRYGTAPAVVEERSELPPGRTLAGVDAAFESGARPVVLVGPGGIGKTSLARAWAARESARWVDLLGVSDTDAVTLRVVTALQAEAHLGSDEGIHRALGSGRPVVFDNAEDLDAAAKALLKGWIERSAVPCLVTSQVPLGCVAERRVVIGELEPAVAASVVREQRSRLGLPPLSEDMLERLLARLGGWPLALVVAAPLADLVDETEVLVSTPVEPLSSHHTSVTDGVGRSISRVGPDGTALLVALAASAGPCDVRYLAEVADLPVAAALRGIADLRGRGLVASAEGRVAALPVVRTLVRSRPGLSESLRTAEARIVQCFVDGLAAHSRLRSLRDELAHAVFLASGFDRIRLLRYHCEMLYSFGPIAQILSTTERALATVPGRFASVATVHRGVAHLQMGMREEGRALLSEGLEGVEHPETFAWGASILATVLAWRGEPSAVDWAHRAVAAAKEVDVLPVRADALHFAGYALAKSGVEEGFEHLESAICLGQERLPTRACSAGLSKARLRTTHADLARCRALLERARPDLGRVQHMLYQADLAVILLGAGELDAGFDLFEEPCSVLSKEHPRALSDMLVNAVPRAMDRPEQARALLDAVCAPVPDDLVRALRAVLDGDRSAVKAIEDSELVELCIAFMDNAALPVDDTWREVRRGFQMVADRVRAPRR